MGGADAVLEKARASFDQGDLRWVAQVVNHVVFAEPDNTRARDLLAQTYQKLGYGSENGTWRNFYLQGAEELRGNLAPTELDMSNSDMAMALTVDQVFDSLAIRVDGPKSWDKKAVIDWNFTDLNTRYRTTLANGVLVQSTPAKDAQQADLSITLTKPELLKLVATADVNGLQTEGDPAALSAVLGSLDKVDTEFAIVTP